MSLSTIAEQRLLQEDLSKTLLARSTGAWAASAILGQLRVTSVGVYHRILERLYTEVQKHAAGTNRGLLLQEDEPKWLVLIEHEPRILPFVATVYVNSKHVRAHTTYDGRTLSIKPHFVSHLAMGDGFDLRVSVFGREIYYMPRMSRESVWQQVSGSRMETPSQCTRISDDVLKSIHHRHHANMQFPGRRSNYPGDNSTVDMLFTRLVIMHASITIEADLIADVCRQPSDRNSYISCNHDIKVDDDGRLGDMDHGIHPCIVLASASIPIDLKTILAKFSSHGVKREWK